MGHFLAQCCKSTSLKNFEKRELLQKFLCQLFTIVFRFRRIIKRLLRQVYRMEKSFSSHFFVLSLSTFLFTSHVVCILFDIVKADFSNSVCPIIILKFRTFRPVLPVRFSNSYSRSVYTVGGRIFQRYKYSQ